MKVNISKTVYTIFTKSHKIAKSKVNIKYQEHPIEKDPNPVYLGVTLDSQLSLKLHTTKLKNKATKRLNLLKRLASTSWGANKNTDSADLDLSWICAVHIGLQPDAAICK